MIKYDIVNPIRYHHGNHYNTVFVHITSSQRLWSADTNTLDFNIQTYIL